MQLKLLYTIVLFLLITSCNKENNNLNEEIAVVGYMFNHIPKVLPPPPPPPKNSELDSSIINRIDYSKLKPFQFSYAIYEKFVNSGLNRKIPNSFFKAKSNELFERENIDSLEMVLVKNLGDIKEDSAFIDKNLLNNYVNEDLLYLNQRFISKEGKEKLKYSINGIISFSRVSFNQQFNRAAIGVGIHRGRLNSSYTIYILEMIKNKWEIKYYLTIEKS